MTDRHAHPEPLDWSRVRQHLDAILEAAAQSKDGKPCFGQERAARAVARRLKDGGAILADEVGLGKTRVALMLMEAVTRAGGTVAAVVPPGLLYQWENEHREFLASLEEGGAGPAEPRPAIKLRSYGNLFNDGGAEPGDGKGARFPLVVQGRGSWLLISHAFGFLHRVSRRTDPRGYELPVLVRALQEKKAGIHGNSLWLQYLRRFNERPRNWRKPAREREERRNGAVLAAAQFLAHAYGQLSCETKRFLEEEMVCPRNRRDDHVRHAADPFATGESGRRAVHEIIGRLLGPIDLLVIDEAHKSREGLPGDGDPALGAMKRLTALVEQILRPRDDAGSRRLCLTATPVELGASQWEDLLRRARIPLADQTRTALTSFETSLASASRTPDQPEALDHLCRAAESFQASLSPYMVRRRRMNQKEHKDLLPAGTGGTAHPHRAMGAVDIEPGGLSPEWRRAVLALEAMSQASVGTYVENADKMATYRYAAAMLDLGDEDATVASSARMDAQTPEGARSRRIARWRSMAAHYANAGCGDSRDYAAHPRVQATADSIERTLARNSKEKILVFGRFTRPMQWLVRELNARYVLRQLAKGNPTLAMRVKDGDLWSCAQRLLLRHDDLGLEFGAGVAMWTARKELDDHLGRAGIDYRNRQRRLARWFGAEWMLTHLPGDSCLKQMDTARLDAVLTQLRSDLLDEILASGQQAVFAPLSGGQASPSATDDPTDGDSQLDDSVREELERTLAEIWSNYIRGAFDPNVADECQPGTEWKGDEDFKEVDALGDRMSPEHLLTAMGLDADGDAPSSGQRGEFCRLMDGGMAMSTRRIVQERFNRQGAFPTVLVAQSLVGREGLNLHRSCRRVVLFHPEWNPAVVEQEIGRVDRIHSLWNEKAKDWHQRQDGSEFPRIHVDFVVFRGTYDEYQFQVLEGRRRSLEAQLFGALLDEAALIRVPPDYRRILAAAAPDFEPNDEG